MTPKESTLIKLQKLMAKAASAEELGNQEEAAAFSAKVQELLIKHKIEMSQVEGYNFEDDPIEQEYITSALGRKRTRVRWTEALAAALCRAYFCNHLVIPGSNTLVFIGRDSDRKIAVWLYNYLVTTCDRLATHEYGVFYRHCRDKLGDVTQARGFRQGFINGFVNEVRRRLNEERKRLYQTMPDDRALVKATTDIEDWVKGNMNTERVGGITGREGSASGADRGKSAGQNVHIKGNIVEHGKAKGPHLLQGGA